MNQTKIYIFITLILSVFIISCKEQNNKNPPVKNDNEIKNSQKDTPSIETTLLVATQKPYFSQYHSNLDGMVSEFVRKMYQDKSGNYWFGTNGDGLIRYDGESLEQFTDDKGFGGTAVREIAEDKEGNIWFGTSGGLSKYDGESFSTFSKNEGLLDNEIWALEIEQNGLIWVGSIEGVSVFDGVKFTEFPIPKADVVNPKPMLSHKRVSKILEDQKGNIWFATDGYGITIYNGKDFTHFSKKNGLPDNNVADILEDEGGNIWIGSMFGGISRYDGKSFTNFTENGIITGIETYNLCEDEKGNIWFSAENIGVYQYNGKSFTLFTKEDGLSTNGIQSILVDKKGQLWFGSWSGVSIYSEGSISNVEDIKVWAK
jgi:ligand-binding sensor domain-containing protein